MCSITLFGVLFAVLPYRRDIGRIWRGFQCNEKVVHFFFFLQKDCKVRSKYFEKVYSSGTMRAWGGRVAAIDLPVQARYLFVLCPQKSHKMVQQFQWGRILSRNETKRLTVQGIFFLTAVFFFLASADGGHHPDPGLFLSRAIPGCCMPWSRCARQISA